MIKADVDFPSGLPCPLRTEDYGFTHGDTLLATQMASGRTVYRQLYDSVPTDVQVSWLFGGSQCAAFEAWYRDSLKNGAAWFNISIRTPVGDGPYVAHFKRKYRGPSLVGRNKWRIVADLELWERPLVDKDWGLLPDYLIESDIFDIAMNDKWPEA